MADSCNQQNTNRSEDKIPLYSIKSKNVGSNYIREFIVTKIEYPSEEPLDRMFLANIRPTLRLNSIYRIERSMQFFTGYRIYKSDG